MKGIKKLPLAAAIAVLSASANAELVALDEEVMGSMTGQAGIKIETTAKIDVDSAAYTANNGSVALEGIKLRGDLAADEALSQTITIDVAKAGTAEAATGVAAAGDVLVIGMTDANIDASVDAIRMGANSVGSLLVEDVKMTGTTTKVYAVAGSQAIGVDTTVNQEIGKIAYTDENIVAGAPAPDAISADNLGEGGTLTINKIKMSAIDMNGTVIEVMDNGTVTAPSAQGGTYDYKTDYISITTPQVGSISNSTASVTIDGIQIGSDTGLLGYDETIGGVIVDQLYVAPGSVQIFAFDSADTPDNPGGSQGVVINQTGIDVRADVTYVSGLISQDAANDYDAAAGNAQGTTTAIYDTASANNDGVGSITAQGLQVTGDVSAAIAVDATSALVVGNTLSNASFSVNSINLGSQSLGGLNVTGMTVSSTATISAH